MSNDLTIKSEFSSQLAELDRIAETCKKLMQTKHYHKLGEEGICAIMARCKALGIHPFEGLNGGFYMVQGKVGMSTEMMAALVRQRGHSVSKITKEGQDDRVVCTLKGKRKDNGDEMTCSFTMQDAKAAGLWNGPTWQKYPAIMLYNRCMSMLFRQLFPDLSLGAGYLPDEINEITKSGEYSECEFLSPEPEESKQVPTLAQVNELTQILEECPKDYAVSMLKGINTRGWKGIGEMDIDAYNNLRSNAIVKRREYQETQISDVRATFVEHDFAEE